ncbi:MAG: hypothetical protein IH891_05385 [Planctomycetes bacterium]|nr:hypothetical protein [Planctomycetota bacterium]
MTASPTPSADLSSARAAFDERRWADAYERFSAAEATSELGVEDLERLAIAQNAQCEAFATAGSNQIGERLETVDRCAVDTLNQISASKASCRGRRVVAPLRDEHIRANDAEALEFS